MTHAYNVGVFSPTMLLGVYNKTYIYINIFGCIRQLWTIVQIILLLVFNAILNFTVITLFPYNVISIKICCIFNSLKWPNICLHEGLLLIS